MREQVIAAAHADHEGRGRVDRPTAIDLVRVDRGDGPDAEDEEDISAAVHGGQIWRYDPRAGRWSWWCCSEPADHFDGPGQHHRAPARLRRWRAPTAKTTSAWSASPPGGETFPFAQNRLSDEEFAGATFSPDGGTLFANIQGPGTTFAIWGPW